MVIGIAQSFCVVLACFFACCSTQDPCVDYKLISDPYRSTGYQWKQGTKAICDHDLAAGYYRFNSSAGNMMPTSKPKPNHCGTHYPVWMEGSHPDKRSFPMKANYVCYDYHGHQVCPFRIFVYYCRAEDFYVYNLQPISRGCPMAYCAGISYHCFL